MDKKKKIIIPIILIPIILIPIILLASVFLCVKYQYVSGKKIIKYLEEKYGGEFEIVRVIRGGRTHEVDEDVLFSCDGSDLRSCTPYTNEFSYQYVIYSKKYNTYFFVEINKKLPALKIVCSDPGIRYPSENIKDNLEEVKNDEILKVLKSEFDNIKMDYKIGNTTYGKKVRDYSYTAIVDDDFNEKHYQKLIKLKKELDKKEYNYSKDFLCDYYIKYNNIEFKYIIYYNTREIDAYCINSNGYHQKIATVGSPDFWNKINDYIGK